LFVIISTSCINADLRGNGLRSLAETDSKRNAKPLEVGLQVNEDYRYRSNFLRAFQPPGIPLIVCQDNQCAGNDDETSPSAFGQFWLNFCQIMSTSRSRPVALTARATSL
jgi:hypothetical protein